MGELGAQTSVGDGDEGALDQEKGPQQPAQRFARHGCGYQGDGSPPDGVAVGAEVQGEACDSAVGARLREGLVDGSAEIAVRVNVGQWLAGEGDDQDHSDEDGHIQCRSAVSCRDAALVRTHADPAGEPMAQTHIEEGDQERIDGEGEPHALGPDGGGGEEQEG